MTTDLDRLITVLERIAASLERTPWMKQARRFDERTAFAADRFQDDPADLASAHLSSYQGRIGGRAFNAVARALADGKYHADLTWPAFLRLVWASEYDLSSGDYVYFQGVGPSSFHEWFTVLSDEGAYRERSYTTLTGVEDR